MTHKKLFTLIVLLIIFFCGVDQCFSQTSREWQSRTGIFQSQIADLLGNTQGSLMVVTTQGELLQSKDNGIEWQILPTPAMVRTLDIDSNNRYLIATNSGLFTSTNNGISWISHTLDIGGTQKALWVDSANIIVSDSEYNDLYLYNSTTGLLPLTVKGKNDSIISINEFSVLDSGRILLRCSTNNRAEIRYSDDHGAHWQHLDPAYGIYNVRKLTANILIGSATNARCYSSSDNGSTWLSLPIPTVALYSSSFCLLHDTLFCYTPGEGIRYLPNQETTWKYSRAVIATASYLNFIKAVGGKLFGYNPGTIYSLKYDRSIPTKDSSTFWHSILQVVSPYHFDYAKRLDDSTIIAVQHSIVLYTTTNGKKWIKSFEEESGWNSVLWIKNISRDSLIAIRFRGDILFSSDRGISWTVREISNRKPDETGYCACFIKGDVITIYLGGTLFTTTDCGLTWKSRQRLFPPAVQMYPSFDSLGNLYAALDPIRSSTTVYTIPYGSNVIDSFTVPESKIPHTYVGPTYWLPSDRLMMIRSDATYYSDDKGKHWNIVEIGAMTLRDPDDSLREAGILSHDGSSIFLGTSKGLIESTDNGSNWNWADFEGLRKTGGLQGIKDITAYNNNALCITDSGLFEYSVFGLASIPSAPLYPQGLILFPNPAKGHAEVQLKIDDNTVASIILYNINGMPIYRDILSLSSGIHNIPISTSQLQAGVYFVNISTNKKQFVSKLVVAP